MLRLIGDCAAQTQHMPPIACRSTPVQSDPPASRFKKKKEKTHRPNRIIPPDLLRVDWVDTADLHGEHTLNTSEPSDVAMNNQEWPSQIVYGEQTA